MISTVAHCAIQQIVIGSRVGVMSLYFLFSLSLFLFLSALYFSRPLFSRINSIGEVIASNLLPNPTTVQLSPSLSLRPAREKERERISSKRENKRINC